MAGSDTIEISFLGGASSIGASCTLVRAAGMTFVVDCGVRYSSSNPLPDLSLLSGVRVDAILVTHAHMDHTGGLPVLVEACPGAPLFATPPTIDLIDILLRDSLRLMNSPDRDADIPLYTDRQVEQLRRSLAPVRFHQPMQAGEIEIRWMPASHILGAAMILMKTPAGTILFTGDYSVSAQHTVPALSRPDFQADMVISESTYGERLHEDRKAAEERLLGQIGRVVEQGGRVLIPAFAVGRAQEVLLILKRGLRNGNLPDVPVFVDGMVRAVCDVYRSHEPYVANALLHEIRRTPHAFYSDSIQPVRTPDDRRRVLSTAPSIIVASSGMLTGGPSQGYCQELAKNAKDAILLTGYQDEESPGRALLNLAQTEGPRLLRLGAATVSVESSFGTYGLSAHADRMQMVSLIEATSPRTVVLVHGDEAAKESLSRSLRCDDIICARDGMTIQRSYARRHARPAPSMVTVPTKEELDVARARHLLGPASETPVRAIEVAEAWFGQRVDRVTAERFARTLEAVGLVRRDDHRRDRLWVLAVQDTSLFPDEAELAESLKRANPKGQLLALCMRLRIDPPAMDMRQHGAFYEACMSLTFRDELLESIPCQAASKKTAEQLAAQALLAAIASRTEDQDTSILTQDDAARLQSANPKGKLLEWCTQHQVPPPQFEHEASPSGYRVRGTLSEPGQDTFVTQWFEASKLKLSEQAAAESLWQRVGQQPVASASPAPDESLPLPQPGEIQHSGRNPAMALNELRQAGILRSTGFDLVDQTGPSHQPEFWIVAWAETPSGQRFSTDRVKAPSKKAAQHLAADQLLDLLVEADITRR